MRSATSGRACSGWTRRPSGEDRSRAADRYDGNVTVRLTGADAAVVTIAGHKTHHEEHRPDDFHRQLVRVIAELSDAAGPFLVRAVHHETRGWQWVSEPL
jgi:hypothetical protein